MSDEATQDDRWVRRYRWHIGAIPELMLLTRQALVPLKAQALSERVQGGGDVRRLPMNGDAVDEADLLWALLVLYAREVAYKLGGSSPEVIRNAVWSSDAEPQGLPPGLTGSAAYALAEMVTSWLIPRALSIAEFAELADTEDHLFGYVRSLRSRYGVHTAEGERRRFCDVCGRHGVVAGFTEKAGIEFSRVWCTHCGHEVEGVTRVGDAHIPASRRTGRTISEDDQTLEEARPPDADG